MTISGKIQNFGLFKGKFMVLLNGLDKKEYKLLFESTQTEFKAGGDLSVAGSFDNNHNFIHVSQIIKYEENFIKQEVMKAVVLSLKAYKNNFYIIKAFNTLDQTEVKIKGSIQDAISIGSIIKFFYTIEESAQYGRFHVITEIEKVEAVKEPVSKCGKIIYDANFYDSDYGKFSLNSKGETIVCKGSFSSNDKKYLFAGNNVSLFGYDIKSPSGDYFHIVKIEGSQTFENEIEESKKTLTKITGAIQSFRYKENGRCIFILRSSQRLNLPSSQLISFRQDPYEIACKYVGEVFLHSKVSVYGTLTSNKYGTQIDVQHIEDAGFENANEIINFLSSKYFKNIGAESAKAIVNHFGMNTLEILEKSNVKDLTKVEGIGKSRAKAIIESYKIKKEYVSLLKFAKEYGISEKKIMKIFDKYQDKSMEIIESNPYSLTELDGIGFKQADIIARNVAFLNKLKSLKLNIDFPQKEFNIEEKLKMLIEKGFAKEAEEISMYIDEFEKNPFRVSALVKYVINKKSNGDTYFTTEKILEMIKGETVFSFDNIDTYQSFETFKLLIKSYFEVSEKNFSYINSDGDVVSESFEKDFVIFDKTTLKIINRDMFSDTYAPNKGIIPKNLCFSEAHMFKKEIGILKFLIELSEKDVLYPVKFLKEYCKDNSIEFDETWNNEKIYPIIKNIIDKYICEEESILGFSLTDEQKDYLYKIPKSRVVAFTGGAGTGKSLSTRLAIKISQKVLKTDPIITTPTGKASKRSMEATQFDKAYTIDLAKLKGLINQSVGYLNADEFGMNSVNLGHKLFSPLDNKYHKALRMGLVGDIQQVPPVEPGNIYRDIIQAIEIGLINGYFVKLTQIQRSKGNVAFVGSEIAMGKESLFNDTDARFLKTISSDTETINKEILTLIKQDIKTKLNSGMLLQDIQIISPQREGTAGVNAINKMIQEEFVTTPVIYQTEYRTVKYGDKLMHLENKKMQSPMGTLQENKKKFSTSKGKKVYVANGDIIYAKERKKVWIESDFEDDLGSWVDCIVCELEDVITKQRIDVYYPIEDFLQITSLAYCATVHKLQGSEYKHVLYVISPSHYLMLNRNLFYTGWTRAKETATFIGSYKHYLLGLQKEVSMVRNTIIELINEIFMKIEDKNHFKTNVIPNVYEEILKIIPDEEDEEDEVA